MADLTIKFPRAAYPSLQVGDMGYYALSASMTSTGGFDNVHADEESTLKEIGKVKSVDHTSTLTDGTLTTTVVFDAAEDLASLTVDNFILFSKDNKVNSSSLLGYYGSAMFKNNSTDKAEMYATSCEISESSK